MHYTLSQLFFDTKNFHDIFFVWCVFQIPFTLLVLYGFRHSLSDLLTLKNSSRIWLFAIGQYFIWAACVNSTSTYALYKLSYVW